MWFFFIELLTTTPEPVRTYPTTTVAPVFQSRVFAVTTTPTTRPTTTTTQSASTATTTTTATSPSTAAPSVVAVTVLLDLSGQSKPTEPEAGISPSQPQPRVDPGPPQQQHNFQASEFCPPVLKHNIMWSRTPKGATAFEMCPHDAKGYAEWSCNDASPPQWTGMPDFSQCTSPWVRSSLLFFHRSIWNCSFFPWLLRHVLLNSIIFHKEYFSIFLLNCRWKIFVAVWRPTLRRPGWLKNLLVAPRGTHWIQEGICPVRWTSLERWSVAVIDSWPWEGKSRKPTLKSVDRWVDWLIE